jgi:energy-coupling factor transporter ATP-binding protein EcfA2
MPDWSNELRMADFDLLVAAVKRWIDGAPAWPPFERAKVLFERIAPRLEELRVNLDRVLVVGVVGGTGTGKSTLLNALVGQRVCPAGDAVRPTTRRPVVLTGPDVDTSFLKIDDCRPEVHRLAARVLEYVVLVDCPDPDTQGRETGGARHADGDGGNGKATIAVENVNLDLLRRILPHCDVILCTGTAQKYKTQAVNDLLLEFAPGRQVVFVQTHAALDADITEDWQLQLESEGFSVPRMFCLDSEAALVRPEEKRPLPAEFSDLVDFLNAQLAGRAGHRILRANALDLLAWFLAEVKRDIDAARTKVTKLQEAVIAERLRLFECVKRRIDDQLRGHQGIWRARLLREVTMRWSGGPFTAFLRLLTSARSFARFLPALRARALGPMLVTGGIGMGTAVADRVRRSSAERSFLASAELGISPGDLEQARSVVVGYEREAGIERRAGVDSASSLQQQSLAVTAQRLYQQLETDVASVVQNRASRRAGGVFHFILEVLFLVLPALLLGRLGRDFFYDHLWLGSTQPLLGFDYLLQSAIWITVWGLALRGLLAWRLQRGLNRDLAKLVERLTPDDALGPLLEEFVAPAGAIEEHAGRLSDVSTDLDRLRRELHAASTSQLSRLVSS